MLDEFQVLQLQISIGTSPSSRRWARRAYQSTRSAPKGAVLEGGEQGVETRRRRALVRWVSSSTLATVVKQPAKSCLNQMGPYGIIRIVLIEPLPSRSHAAMPTDAVAAFCDQLS